MIIEEMVCGLWSRKALLPLNLTGEGHPGLHESLDTIYLHSTRKGLDPFFGHGNSRYRLNWVARKSVSKYYNYSSSTCN